MARLEGFELFEDVCVAYVRCEGDLKRAACDGVHMPRTLTS